MNLELDHPCLAAFDPTNDTRVLMIGDDWTAGRQARDVLARIAANCQAEGRLLYHCWNFEVLGTARLRELAASESAAADIIVFAMQDRSELPKAVLEWINDWFAMENYCCRALVAIVVSDPAQSIKSTPVLLQLKKLAEMGEIDFFATCAEENGQRNWDHPLASHSLAHLSDN